MNAEADNVFLIPGLDVVGRGIYLRPRQPYELKNILIKRDNNQPHYCRELEKSYPVPASYAVDDSPPMPVNQALNQTLVEESWERLNKQLGLNASVTASNNLFSVDVNASQIKQFRTEQNAYYALRSSFIPLWDVYLPQITIAEVTLAAVDVPVPFSHQHRKQYDEFFEQNGTHYIKRAWVGGKAILVFIIAKSAYEDTEQVRASVKASLGGLVSGGAEENVQQAKERLQSNSECKVLGAGGNKDMLAKLSTLDEVCYNEWLKTIKANPEVIELEVAGIWTLLDDPEKAAALQEAYTQVTAFDPISAIFPICRQLYFIRGDKYFRYDLDSCETSKPAPNSILLPILSKPEFSRFERPDATFTGYGLSSPTGSLDDKLFLFKRTECLCVDINTPDRIEPGYPKAIAEAWPGVSFDRIDAMVNAGPDSLYFIRGNRYIRFNTNNYRADDGYPALLNERWAGMIFERVDAAIYWGNGKVYFFKDDQYIRYDLVLCRADPGYPKFITSNYVEDWKFFV